MAYLLDKTQKPIQVHHRTTAAMSTLTSYRRNDKIMFTKYM